MSYRTPTSRRTKKKKQGLNLIPILDAIFILIFFLLMSAQFVKIYEIGSDVPIVSDQEPPKDKKKPPPKQKRRSKVLADDHEEENVVREKWHPTEKMIT